MSMISGFVSNQIRQEDLAHISKEVSDYGKRKPYSEPPICLKKLKATVKKEAKDDNQNEEAKENSNNSY